MSEASRNMNDFIKITDEMVYSDERNGERLPLCEWVNGLYTGNICDFYMRFDEAIVDCESPIEQALVIEMEWMNLRDFKNFYNKRIEILGIENQAEIEACGNKYRADFAIPVAYRTKSGLVLKTFVIECDGHDYHEKTKEQVAKNNQRERDLKTAGYEIIRFSGSEIYKSAYKCVKDLMHIIAETYFQLQ